MSKSKGRTHALELEKKIQAKRDEIKKLEELKKQAEQECYAQAGVYAQRLFESKKELSPEVLSLPSLKRFFEDCRPLFNPS